MGALNLTRNDGLTNMMKLSNLGNANFSLFRC